MFVTMYVPFCTLLRTFAPLSASVRSPYPGSDWMVQVDEPPAAIQSAGVHAIVPRDTFPVSPTASFVRIVKAACSSLKRTPSSAVDQKRESLRKIVVPWMLGMPVHPKPLGGAPRGSGTVPICVPSSDT